MDQRVGGVTWARMPSLVPRLLPGLLHLIDRSLPTLLTRHSLLPSRCPLLILLLSHLLTGSTALSSHSFDASYYPCLFFTSSLFSSTVVFRFACPSLSLHPSYRHSLPYLSSLPLIPQPPLPSRPPEVVSCLIFLFLHFFLLLRSLPARTECLGEP